LFDSFVLAVGFVYFFLKNIEFRIPNGWYRNYAGVVFK